MALLWVRNFFLEKSIYYMSIIGKPGLGSRFSGSRMLKMLSKKVYTTWNRKNDDFLYILKNLVFT